MDEENPAKERMKVEDANAVATSNLQFWKNDSGKRQWLSNENGKQLDQTFHKMPTRKEETVSREVNAATANNFWYQGIEKNGRYNAGVNWSFEKHDITGEASSDGNLRNQSGFNGRKEILIKVPYKA